MSGPHVTSVFHDRAEAGQRLAEAVARQPVREPVVLALPRGGVPVGYEVARRLGAPMEAFVARKVGAPGHPELGIGAVAEGGTIVRDRSALEELDVDDAAFAALVGSEREELWRRIHRYRGDRALPELRDRDLVVVDDGLATGVTAEAALLDVRRRWPRSVRLAVPVCAASTVQRLGVVADGVVCLHSPERSGAVGRWYDRFDETSDDEVLELLAAARPCTPAATPTVGDR